MNIQGVFTFDVEEITIIPEMDIVLSSLREHELLMIVCDHKARAKIHYYLEQFFPELGHLSITHPCYPHSTSKYIVCSNCHRMMQAEYSRGILTNNQDESWDAYCEGCEQFLEYECNYDPELIRIELSNNNAICISRHIQIKKTRSYPPADISESSLNHIFDTSEVLTFTLPSDYIIRGCTGRRSKGKLRRRREELANYFMRSVLK